MIDNSPARAVRPPAVVFVVLGIALLLAPTHPLVAAQQEPKAPAEGKWTKVPATPRFGHSAALLGDGRVLVAGGCLELNENNVCLEPTAETEVYDPKSGTWSPGTPMAVARSGHMTVALPNGDALVAGGCSVYNEFVCKGPANSAEIFDAGVGTWKSTGPPSAQFGPAAFRDHSAILLSRRQQVLIVGPQVDQIYDLTTGSWTPAGSRTSAEQVFVHHASTELPDGTVLVLAAPGGLLADGGLEPETRYLDSIYDPSRGAWKSAAPDLISRDYQSATLLDTRRVLVAGGLGADGKEVHASSELFDHEATDPEQPGAAGGFAPTGSLTTARFAHTATLLRGGKVLVVGGSDRIGANLASAEIFDPASGQWSSAGAMASARGAHLAGTKDVIAPGAASFTATRLRDGRVLVVGGSQDGWADLYTPAEEVAAAGDVAGGAKGGGTGRIPLVGAGVAGAAALVLGTTRVFRRRHRRIAEPW